MVVQLEFSSSNPMIHRRYFFLPDGLMDRPRYFTGVFVCTISVAKNIQNLIFRDFWWFFLWFLIHTGIKKGPKNDPSGISRRVCRMLRWKSSKITKKQNLIIFGYTNYIDKDTSEIPRSKTFFSMEKKNTYDGETETLFEFVSFVTVVTTWSPDQDFPKFVNLWSRISPSSRGVRSSD